MFSQELSYFMGIAIHLTEIPKYTLNLSPKYVYYLPFVWTFEDQYTKGCHLYSDDDDIVCLPRKRLRRRMYINTICTMLVQRSCNVSTFCFYSGVREKLIDYINQATIRVKTSISQRCCKCNCN